MGHTHFNVLSNKLPIFDLPGLAEILPRNRALVDNPTNAALTKQTEIVDPRCNSLLRIHAVSVLDARLASSQLVSLLESSSNASNWPFEQAW